MHWLLGLLAQAAPDGVSGQWPGILGGAIGGGGLSTGILWKIHSEDRARNERLESRLFLLTSAATEVGKTAAEVAHNEPTDPELLAAMARVEALLQERSR